MDEYEGRALSDKYQAEVNMKDLQYAVHNLCLVVKRQKLDFNEIVKELAETLKSMNGL